MQKEDGETVGTSEGACSTFWVRLEVGGGVLLVRFSAVIPKLSELIMASVTFAAFAASLSNRYFPPLTAN